MEENKSLHKVEERLTYLFNIKSPLIGKQRQRKEKYVGNRIKTKNPYKSDYKTNTIFSIINAKKAELLTGIQEYDFIPLDDDAQKNKSAIKHIWNYEWLKSKTDKEISRVIHSSLLSGDGFMYEGTRRIKRKIKVPFENNEGVIEYKDDEIIEYDGIYCEYIPWEDIYFDGETIEDSNEVIWVKHWDRKTFINTFGNNMNYINVNDNLPIGKYYYFTTDVQSKDYNTSLNIAGNLNDLNIISELRYYNKSNDEFIVLANGIEVRKGIIPYKHKELPFCKFEDYPVEGRFYSMGEYELLEGDEDYKDALRSLQIDVIKAQMGFTVVDPDADFDEATVEIGTNKFARISPKDIGHFSPNINSGNIYQAELKADDDIIIKSGIDYKAQILGQSETARKTSAKQESARKRINLNLKLNGYSFFERLARLRMSNLQQIYSNKDVVKIPIKGGNIDSNGVFSPLNDGYGTFTVKPEYVKGLFNIIPITESITGISSEREKAKKLEFAQIAGNIPGDDGKPVLSGNKLVEWLARDFGVDFEKLSASTSTTKSAEDIIKDIDLNSEGLTNDATNPMSPEFIPPEQRSGANKNVPIIGGIGQE